jgi:hypothetical protein
MTKKILITGCSYGCGEWSNNPYGNTHRGIASYLEEKGYTVTNVSKPGANNCVALENIKKIHKEFDYVIFLLTAVSRDVNSYFPYDSTVSALDNANKIANRVIEEIYKVCGTKTILVGALYKVPANNLKFLAQINGVDILIPNNKFPTTYFNPHDLMSLHNGLGHIDLKTFKKEILKCNDEYFWKTMEEHPEYYQPDGVHWNREAHRIITEEILKYL